MYIHYRRLVPRLLSIVKILKHTHFSSKTYRPLSQISPSALVKFPVLFLKTFFFACIVICVEFSYIKNWIRVTVISFCFCIVLFETHIDVIVKEKVELSKKFDNILRWRYLMTSKKYSPFHMFKLTNFSGLTSIPPPTLCF